MAYIFISYSSKDKEIAVQIAEGLQLFDHKIWLDEWEIKIGQCIPSEIEKGIKNTDFLILVLSKHSVKSNWVDREWKTAYWEEANTNSIKILPVCIEECEIPQLLKTKKYASFYENFEEGLKQLINSIQFLEKERLNNSKKRIWEDDIQISDQNAAELELHVSQQKKSNNKMPIFGEILNDYESCLSVFFDPESGAVFEPGRDDGTPKFLFTEVTGYAIKDFLLLHSLTGNGEYIDKAKRSADWIKNKALDPCGGVKTRYYFDKDTEPYLIEMSFYGRRIYSLDTAICLSALIALFDITKDPSYREISILLGDFLINRMIGDTGKVYSVYNAITETNIPEEDKWSKRFGAFHTKVAEALVDLYSVTEDEKYLNKAMLICIEAIKFQRPEGNFETSNERTELHPHCYAAEGLLYVGKKTNNKEFIIAARRATEWALRLSHKGEIPQIFDFNFTIDKSYARFRTDTLAQILALAVDLTMIGQLDKKYTQQIDAIALKLLEMRSNVDKCFRYGFYEQEYNGKLESDTRSYWTNMFCLRGLYKYFLSSILSKTDLFILAGGLGSRCWPISCETMPKHLAFNLLGDRSLLQETIRRYTYDNFIQPNQIFILCNEAGKHKTWEQVKSENIPYENIIIEKVPNGTVPAVMTMLDELQQRTGRDNCRIIIVSMADDVIEPYQNFQNALIPALFVVKDNDCIVSVGKSFDKEQTYDNRFGHMLYSKRINSYRCYQVSRFEEKPAPAIFEELKQSPDNIAWEGGTVIFSETYFKKVSQDLQTKGNLAEEILSRATPWLSNESNKHNVAVSILDNSTRFEDLGVPGRNLHKFFQGDKRYNIGSGNICLGNQSDVRILYCSNNLIISDKLSMKLYGLNGYLIIDNSWTNSTVIMPLENVDELPTLYRVLEKPEKLRPFIIGGSSAREAKSNTFARNGNPKLESGYGLVFTCNCDDKLSINRQQESLCIINRELPEMGPEDYDNLIEKQLHDPKLVEHLIHIAALADYFRGDEIVLSKTAQKALRLLCLYHDFGGYLSDEKEKLETEIVRNFEKISKLDRRLLDTRIINELLKAYPCTVPPGNDEVVGLLNDSVNSAVEFLRYRKVENPALRDIILFMMQVQDDPRLFARFSDNVGDKFGFSLEEIEKVFACFKIAEHFSNGRWLWKRSKYYSPSDSRYQGFLQFDKGPLEGFPFTITFTIDWFQKAHIKPNVYINRLNEVLRDDNSSFFGLLKKLQQGESFLTSDMIYCYLLRTRVISKTELENIINKGINEAVTRPEQKFQLLQILVLPFELKTIKLNSEGINKDDVNLIADIILNECHVNWQQINNLAQESALQLLRKWEPLK